MISFSLLIVFANISYKFDDTLLEIACKEENEEIVEFLLKSGSPLHRVNKVKYSSSFNTSCNDIFTAWPNSSYPINRPW